jgi:hypothetical protein
VIGDHAEQAPQKCRYAGDPGRAAVARCPLGSPVYLYLPSVGARRIGGPQGDTRSTSTTTKGPTPVGVGPFVVLGAVRAAQVVVVRGPGLGSGARSGASHGSLTLNPGAGGGGGRPGWCGRGAALLLQAGDDIGALELALLVHGGIQPEPRRLDLAHN